MDEDDRRAQTPPGGAQAPTRARRSRTPVPRAVDLAGPGRRYVYCVIDAATPVTFGRIGIGAEPAQVHTIQHRDIAAVVSDTQLEVHDPTRENVLAHERVNDVVMQGHTVIPMSFGTVFSSCGEVEELLRSAYDSLKDVLVKMRDKLEFGLEVLWDRDQVVRDLEAHDVDLRRLRDEIAYRTGSTYFARGQYGRLLDSLLQERSERSVREVFAALRGASVASRTNKPIGERMLLNAAFLVARDQEAAFDALVKEVAARLDHLTLKCTGPWPPYNFVDIRLRLERARDTAEDLGGP